MDYKAYLTSWIKENEKRRGIHEECLQREIKELAELKEEHAVLEGLMQVIDEGEEARNSIRDQFMTEKARKPRSDSEMYQLPKDVLAQVNDFLLNKNMKYSDIQHWLETEHNMRVSISSISNYAEKIYQKAQHVSDDLEKLLKESTEPRQEKTAADMSPREFNEFIKTWVRAHLEDERLSPGYVERIFSAAIEIYKRKIILKKP